MVINTIIMGMYKLKSVDLKEWRKYPVNFSLNQVEK
jgi:hypothetical protein